MSLLKSILVKIAKLENNTRNSLYTYKETLHFSNGNTWSIVESIRDNELSNFQEMLMNSTKYCLK